MQENQLEEMNQFIIFKIKGGLYSINSRHITTIMQLPEHETVNGVGIFLYRGEAIQMLDLRTRFGMTTRSEEYKSFAEMLDVRKQDHVNWVNELERTLTAGEKFKLTTDPHECAFGKWYDHYQPENEAIQFHLGKIHQPHEALHRSAVEAEHYLEQNDTAQVANILNRVKEDYVPTVLRMLEEAKGIFRETVFREMVMIIGGSSGMGIVVDEVISVENLMDSSDQKMLHTFRTSNYIAGVQRREKTGELVLELDLLKLLENMS